MPAPENNTNAARHGLVSGNLPRGCAYVVRIVNQYRAAVESAVIEAHGKIDVYHASLIQTVCRWERHALLCQRWMRKEGDKLTPEQRLTFSRDLARASSERDKTLKALGLDAQQGSSGDEWAAVDRQLAQEAKRAAEAKPEARPVAVSGGAQLGGDYD
jgi:hypothetical protein